MPGYRPPSAEPRGKWAKRIHEKRRAEGLSQTGAFELLRERLGFGPKSRFSYTALDMGTREPNDREAAVLADWLGGYPDEIMPSPDNGSTSAPGLGALIEAQTAAIDRQTAMLERVLEAITQRTLDPVAVEELQRWGLAAKLSQPSDDPAAGQSAPTP